MKPTPSRLLAISSLAVATLLAAAVACAATHPQYGSTLRVEISASNLPLDPIAPVANADQADAQRHMGQLLYETLVTLDADGNPQPLLAVSWQHDPDFHRWEFQLRPGVRFHSGAPLTYAVAIDSLQRSAHDQGWHVAGWDVSGNEGIVIESANGASLQDVLYELTLPRHAIVHNSATGLDGTGPFRLAAQQQQPSQVSLVANDAYWRGRPFLDSIQISLGVPERQQLIDLEVGNADVVQVAPDQLRRVQQEGRRVIASSPVELLVLIFNLDHRAVQDQDVRQAIAGSIDRASIANVLLQRQAEPSAALLPQWISGYSFLFRPTKPQATHNSSAVLPLILNYDFADPIAKLVAERIAVNARDAGVAITPIGENLAQRPGNPDVKLLRLRLDSLDPKTALLELSQPLALEKDSILRARSPLDLFRAESAALADFRLVPIAHLSEAVGISLLVRDWAPSRSGEWPLADVWLATATASPRP